MRVSALPELQAYPPSFSPPPKAAMEARDFSRVSLHDIMQYQASFSKYGAYYQDVILGGSVGEYYMKEEQKSA